MLVDEQHWLPPTFCLLLSGFFLPSTLCSPRSISQEVSATARANSQALAVKTAYMQGQDALVRGDVDEAEQRFREVLTLDPQNAGAHANLGVIAMRHREWNRALAELKTAERLAPNVPGIRLNIGLAYYRQAEYRAAIGPLESVVRDQPDSLQPRFLLGLCYFLSEKYAEALKALNPLWAEESTNLSYLYIVSVAADKCGDRAVEDQAAARLLQVGGNSPEVHLLIGKAELARRANESAIKELQIAARANPHLPFVHFYLGMAYRRLHEFRLAEQEFRQDLIVDPGVAYTYNELGMVCSYLGQQAQAREYFRQALRFDSRLASSYYGLAKIDYQEKRYTEAWTALAEAGRLDPHSASVHYLRAEVLLGMGRRADSQAEFRVAARMQKAVRDELLREINGARVPNPELGTQGQ